MSEGREIRLKADFPSVQGSFTYSTSTWTNIIPDSPHAWNLDTVTSAFGGITYGLMWTMNTIDLGGLELEKETFFPVGSTIQDPNVYFNDDTTTGVLHVIDLITDKLIEPRDAVHFVSMGPTMQSNYGMMGDDNDATTIVMGQYRMMTGNTNLTYPQMMRTEVSTSFSSGEPTAASKLYCYRIVVPYVALLGVTNIRIPASRFYLTGVRDKEDDKVYMMRLKRSYELDQSQG